MSEREIAIVTGTRKGIGRFLAEHLVQKGVLVVGCSRKTVDWQLKNYEHHIADVGDEAQVKDMVSDIRTKHGRLDILINNAGVASMNHVLLTPAKTVDRILSTNFRGTFIFCREAAKLMKRRNYGRIVTVSTIAVPHRLAGESVYAASKSAVATFT